MACSSSSSIQKSFKYDVFLSFRGEDTRNNFVGHLYRALQQKGIETYKDDKKIEQGKPIKEQLIKSIEGSRFSIIVFSKTYASSSWCLDELVHIMDCKKTTEQNVYPVFFDVEPTEVRKQSGAVKKAFSEHEKKEAAGKWREAMKEASDLAGWELKGDESELIQLIVNVIFKEKCSILSNTDGKLLVGMETRISDVLSSLDIGTEDVRMIGIKGMGGGGKTTLAGAVCDQISLHFEGISFVENVRAVSKESPSGLKMLQKQILADVLNKQDIIVSSVRDGKRMMGNMMRGTKVIIVLDDVDHKCQLEALAGDLNWFKSGSRIIITTRDEQVLVSHGVSLICNVNLLTDEEAICLFRRYASRNEILNQGCNEMSRQVVRYAAGLPLTIKVLGSSLLGKNDLEWNDALERLKKVPEHETQEILKTSYDALENDYKDIFLDVACILKGEQKDKAIRVLESCGFNAIIGLRVLEQKSLIDISQGGSLRMHDLIEEMGKSIVCQSHPNEPNRDSRLWIEEKIEDILDNDLVNETIRCIKLSQSELKFKTVMRGLRNMRKLRVLYMCSGANWNYSKVSQCFPDSLQYLSWRSYPFLSLHETFQADNLVGLDMSFSSIVQIWEGGKRKVLTKLRFLDLSYSKLTILNFEVTPKLEKLNLEHCTDLKELYIPYGCPKLQYLNLDFSNLRNLSLGPTPDLGTLSLEGCSNLLQVHMSQCPKLTVLNLNRSELRTLDLGLTLDLETLSLEGCNVAELHMPRECPKLKFISFRNSKLRKLNLGLTPNLQRLDLKYCSNLVDINAPDGCLQKLVYLDLSGCGRFIFFLFDKQSNPLKVGSLSKLHLIGKSRRICSLHPYNSSPKFRFECFYKEDPAASSFGNLEKLISIGLCSCTNLESFSRSICSLQCLKKLKLEGSIPEVSKDVHQLQCLEKLSFSKTEIKNLPDGLCMLKQLKSLKLEDCFYLRSLPEDFGELESLEKLMLSSTWIIHLPDSICMLKHLKYLEISSLAWDQKLLENLGRLQCLEELCLSNANIKNLPDGLCMLKQLKSLKLEDFSDLEKLPKDFGQLESLQELCLSCANLKHLPDGLCMLKQLKSLKLDHCQDLERLPEDISQLESLQELCLSNAKIKHLPDGLCMLKQLKSLKLEYCSDLEKLPKDFGQLESLQELRLSNAKIKHLPDGLCMLKQLKSLKLYCGDLEKLPKGFGQLESLQELCLSYAKIKHLPDGLCMLKQLKSLKLYCSDLEKLPKDFGQLESLQELCLSIANIKHLPDGLCQLKSLELYCGDLEKLPKGFGQFESLQELCLSYAKIKHLPDGLCMLKQLKSLKLHACLDLKILPEDFGKLESLEKLMLLNTGISRLPDSICMLKHLKYLEIGWDQKLLEDLGRLQCLEKLIFRRYRFSGGFPKSIFELKRLKYFHLLNCIHDDLPEELGHLKFLEELDITGTMIRCLPQSIFQLKGLRIIGSKTTLELCGLTPVKRTSYNGDYETFCYTVV